jgi:flavorubredoxin
MSASKVELFADGIYRHSTYIERINLSFSQFFIQSASGTLCIETGSRGDFPLLKANMLQAGIDVSSVNSLIVPHFEDDEMGALPEFIALNPSLTTYAHPICTHALADIFSAKTKPFKDETPTRINDEVVIPIFAKHVHQWDALVIYVPRFKALFSSDIFMSFGPVDAKVANPVEGMISSIESSGYLPSLDHLHIALNKIKQYDIEWIFPMHGPAIRDNAKGVIDGLIQYCVKSRAKEAVEN